YTAIMGRDEQKAFELLKKNRELQKPIIEQYNGRWIKELGDGVMASFNTVSDAVNAAIKIQEACNAAKDFQLRIGIHLGEVVFENDDVFGDGVNIASRIQAIAIPGTIFVSESVHNNLSNKIDFHTKFVKAEKLKNVKDPVKIYQVIGEGVVAAPHQPIGRKIKTNYKALIIFAAAIILLTAGYFIKNFFSSRNHTQASTDETFEKSIAVLPFDNMSGDSSQEYFSDGMTESLISDLAQIPGLLVIARNSVFQYKGRNVSPVDVGKQLNVRYILESSLQRSGDILRINVNLIETKKGFQIWAHKFDRKVEDVFLVQDDISRHIIDSLKIAFAKGDGTISKRVTANMEAYEYYLRGHYLKRKSAANSRQLIDSAIVLLEKAVSLDPKFALAYADLGKAYNTIFFIYDPDSKWESKAYVATEKALSLDPTLADAYVAKGELFWTLSNGFPHEKAIKELKHAIKLNPNLVEAHENLGSVYFHIGMLDEALRELRMAVTLDPAGRFSKPRIARVHWYQQKFDSALAEFSALPASGMLREQAIVLWSLGRTDKAFKTLEKLETLKISGTEEADLAAAYAVLYAGVGRKKEAEEKISIAMQKGQGVSHFHHAEHLIASAYALMGDNKAAVAWLEKTAEHGLPCYPLFNGDPNLKSLKNDPGFISFMEKLKRQWEHYKATL
ncbi:MAG TPA: tetratricopeptide repeat protein, partial [Chitinophagaceae bacterium]|nr:tetratricopeptide repeat protein [Chitinophagaceae bacterium]